MNFSLSNSIRNATPSVKSSRRSQPLRTAALLALSLALPLAALEAPCMLRTIACESLDRQGLSWRVAFVSPSLAGLWAATAAGLGIALRTPVGWPPSIRILDPVSHGLPALPKLGLVLHKANKDIGPTAEHLASIISQALGETLIRDWLSNGHTV